MLVSPTVTYTATTVEGEDQVTDTYNVEDEYYDWFLGTEKEYTTTYTDKTDETYKYSLQKALVDFRLAYPTAESLADSYDTYENDEKNKDSETNKIIFTNDEYNLIKGYIEKGKLILYQQSWIVNAGDDGISLIIQPIEVTVNPSADDGTLCFGYVTMVIETSGDAPTVMAGFGDITYPDGFTPSLRIGLKQIKAANAEDKTLTINLTDATLVKYDESDVTPDHLGTVDSDDTTYLKLYLVGTDDPAYKDIFGSDFSQYDLPIATLVSLYADEDKTSVKNLMQIYFDSENLEKYGFHEGYHYYMTVFFEEKDDQDNTIENVCFGTFLLEMKVVPEYLVWQGDETKNWNDDSMWKRASFDQLKKLEGDSYTDNDNETQTDNGFVPMLFSNVVMPAGSNAQLYMAGFSTVDGSTTWSDGTIPSDMVSPSENVMYDLMTYGSGSDSNTAPFTTERYRVNLCNQIHLSTGAQLLHSELLLYQKAHVEVAVPQSTWTLVSLPLKDIVAGDWYIKGGKTEEKSELFTDLKFSSSDNDSRYNPLVYQRGWNSTDAVIVLEEGKDTVPSYASTGWSSVYNDTYSSFAAGSGYSIKAYTQGGSSTGSSLVFRFPKADTTYDYSNGSLSRTNAGKLFVSDLVNRSITGGYTQDTASDIYNESGITVDVYPTEEGYCLIGNPFTAPMSMKEFLDEDENSSSLKSKYWTGYGYSGGSNGEIKLTSEGTGDYLLQPYEAIFVEADKAEKTTIYFTKDMQVLDTSSANNMVAFSIRAQNANGKSSAAFAYSDTASDGYDADEDAILLKDASLQNSSMPLVYTVAGDKAVSINTLNSQTTIPLGVFVDDNSTYTLTFVGVDNVVEPTLYDAETNTRTPITEGYSIEITGATHGRYYINSLGKTSTGIVETAEQSYGMNAYSPSRRTVTVSSNAELRTIEIYSVNGTLQKRVNVTDNSYATTISGVDSGIAIIRALTDEGTFVRKIGVK